MTKGIIFSLQDFGEPGNASGGASLGLKGVVYWLGAGSWTRGWSLGLKDHKMGRGLRSGAEPGARGRGDLVGKPGCPREFGCLCAPSRRGCGGVRARMLEVHIPSVGPEAEEPRQSPEKGHMVSNGWRVRVGIRGNIPSTSAKGTQHSGLGRPSQRFGVTGFASPSDDGLGS